jgi:hypothetical protein
MHALSSHPETPMLRFFFSVFAVQEKRALLFWLRAASILAWSMPTNTSSMSRECRELRIWLGAVLMSIADTPPAVSSFAAQAQPKEQDSNCFETSVKRTPLST